MCLLLLQLNTTTQRITFISLPASQYPPSKMKASGSYNVITDLEPYSDMYNSQFFAIATAFALVLATTVAGKAIGAAVSPPCCFFIISCEPDL